MPTVQNAWCQALLFALMDDFPLLNFQAAPEQDAHLAADRTYCFANDARECGPLGQRAGTVMSAFVPISAASQLPLTHVWVL